MRSPAVLLMSDAPAASKTAEHALRRAALADDRFDGEVARRLAGCHYCAHPLGCKSTAGPRDDIHRAVDAFQNQSAPGVSKSTPVRLGLFHIRRGAIGGSTGKVCASVDRWSCKQLSKSFKVNWLDQMVVEAGYSGRLSICLLTIAGHSDVHRVSRRGKLPQ